MSFFISGLVTLVIRVFWLLFIVAAYDYPEPVPELTEVNPQCFRSLDGPLNEIHTQDRSELKLASKRALSLLTRWRNIGGVGRRTNALSKNPRAPLTLIHGDLDSMAKTMPGRRVGGPLRWGRRR